MHCPLSSPAIRADAHVHLAGPGALESAARAGIAILREAGMRLNAEKGGRPEGTPGLRVTASCWALYKQGGYGARFGIPVEGRSEVKAEIRRLKNAGADIIKIMASGAVSLKRPGRITPGAFSREEIEWIVGAAGDLDLRVMAHANGEPAIIAAASAGVRSIEHGFFMTENALDALAEKAVFWTPTVGALERAARASVDPETREFVSNTIAAHLTMIGRAYSRGVPLAAGTDCVLPDPCYRQAFEAEIAYFEKAGVPRDEAVRIAGEGGAGLLLS